MPNSKGTTPKFKRDQWGWKGASTRTAYRNKSRRRRRRRFRFSDFRFGRRWSSGDSMVRSPAVGAIDDDDDVGFGERRRWWRRRVAQLRGHRQRSPNSPAITVVGVLLDPLGPPGWCSGCWPHDGDVAGGDSFFGDIPVRGDAGARAIGATDDAAAVQLRGRRRRQPGSKAAQTH